MQRLKWLGLFVAAVWSATVFGQAPAAGVNVVYEEFGPGDNDLSTQLTRIRGTNAQAIICWTVTPAGVVFLKNAQQLG